jgi:hypothetical protein
MGDAGGFQDSFTGFPLVNIQRMRDILDEVSSLVPTKADNVLTPAVGNLCSTLRSRRVPNPLVQLQHNFEIRNEILLYRDHSIDSSFYISY